MNDVRRRTSAVTAVLIGIGLWVAVPQPAQAAAAPTCFGKKATIVGGAKSTTIRGTNGDDVIYAGNGNDTVYGKGGDDLICGGFGADRLHGGYGDDWLDGGYGNKVGRGSTLRIQNDVLHGDAGDDFFSPVYDGRAPGTSPDVISFADAGDNMTINAATHVATGEGTDRWVGQNAAIVGSPRGDTFLGSNGNDVFDGGNGSDTISGFGGDDVLRDDHDRSGHTNTDRISGGFGNDLLITGGGHDTLDGGDGNDTLNDYSHWAGTMLGGPGNDVINDGIGISASQRIDGGDGVDSVSLYPNAALRNLPRLAVDLAARAGTFRDSARTRFTVANADRLYVHGLPLTFVGDDGDNVVWTDGKGGGLSASGNGGNDTFYGTSGDDVFNGGLGIDSAWLRGGSDTCTGVEHESRPCPAP